MKKAPIKLIKVDAEGHLQIYPDVVFSGNLKHIYRDASGITWNEVHQALAANEPDRWEPNRLFAQIICAAINEYGLKLEIAKSTEWSSNISKELKADLIKTADNTYLIFGN